MKFKREKQKLVIELNGREEEYLKIISDKWAKNVKIKELAGSTVVDVYDNLMANFSTYLATRAPVAEYETRGWIAEVEFLAKKKEGKMKFRKKPIVVEAIQLTRENLGEVSVFLSIVPINNTPDVGMFHLYIDTLEGRMRANLGDWIIKGVNGEFYPCKPDIFEKTYEAVE